MSGPNAGISDVGHVSLSDVTPISPADIAGQQLMSTALEGAIKKATTLPGHGSDPVSDPSSMVGTQDTNQFVREDAVQPDAGLDPEMERQIDQVADKFTDLYVEVTNFSVAWSVAKRTGRDIETLLRAQ